MSRALQILLILAVAAVNCAAEDTIDGFIGKTYKGRSGAKMPYRLFVPKNYDRQKSYPLILWLHGGGSAGDDNRGQISLDNKLGTHFWTTSENQAKHPAFVLAPQSTADWDSNASRSLSDNLVLVSAILDAVRSEYNIDPLRMYVAGQSNGGIGAFGLITKKPDLFAAAIPLCGAGNPSLASKAAKTAVWAFHGEIDDTIPVEHTRDMIAAIRKAGGQPKYTEYKGVGHDIWERVFKEPGLTDWLFAQHR